MSKHERNASVTNKHHGAPQGTPRHRPTRRERRLQAEVNDWRAALRDAAPLLRVHRAFG